MADDIVNLEAERRKKALSLMHNAISAASRGFSSAASDLISAQTEFFVESFDLTETTHSKEALGCLNNLFGGRSRAQQLALLPIMERVYDMGVEYAFQVKKSNPDPAAFSQLFAACEQADNESDAWEVIKFGQFDRSEESRKLLFSRLEAFFGIPDWARPDLRILTSDIAATQSLRVKNEGWFWTETYLYLIYVLKACLETLTFSD